MNLFSTTIVLLLIQLPRTINFRAILSTFGVVVSESILLLILTIHLSPIRIWNYLSFIRYLWIFNTVFAFSILLTYHVFYLFADIRTAPSWKVLLRCLVNVFICLWGCLVHAFKSLLLWCRRITARIWSLVYFVLTFILLTRIDLGEKMRFRLKCWILITKWVTVGRHEITTTFSDYDFTWLLGPFPSTVVAAVFFLLICTILLA